MVPDESSSSKPAAGSAPTSQPDPEATPSASTWPAARPGNLASPQLRGLAVLVLLALALAWVSVPGSLRFGRDPTVASLDTSPLRTLQGDPAQLASIAAGRPLVVNLWASWCGPCRFEMPLLEARTRQRPDVAFVFANQGEDVFTTAHYLEASGLALGHVLLDPQQSLGRAAGSRALPITLFFDAGGKLASTHVGVLTAGSLTGALKRIAPDGSGKAR